MYMRVTRGRIDLARLDEAASAVSDIIAPVSRLPGFQSYMTGADRTSGNVIAVSTWDTEEHARVSNDAVADVASKLQALGLQLEPFEIFEVTTPT